MGEVLEPGIGKIPAANPPDARPAFHLCEPPVWMSNVCGMAKQVQENREKGAAEMLDLPEVRAQS